VYQSYKRVLCIRIWKPLVRSMLACVDLVGDAIYSVVPLSLVVAVAPMVNKTVTKVIKSCLYTVFKLTVDRAY